MDYQKGDDSFEQADLFDSREDEREEFLDEKELNKEDDSSDSKKFSNT